MAAPGPFVSGGSNGAGAPPGQAQAQAHHYRVALELGLDAYPPLDDAYRQPHMHESEAFGRMQQQQQQQQQQHHHVPQHGHQQHTVPNQHHRLNTQQTGQFGILAPTPVPVPVPVAVEHHQNADAFAPHAMGQDTGERSTGPLNGRIVVDPPDLQTWREKLFNVDDTIVLTHEEFEVYFPHVDNVYSHRSTQKYKRKPFVSHYWDCRMKGRPPGTPKSDDPNKKKRKRNARERDLCDVKIKITEYFGGAEGGDMDGMAQQHGMFTAGGQSIMPQAAGQRFWTIQRVNGNGGNGKGDGAAGPHRHTLDRSDEIKKNSVQRYIAKQETEAKKTQHKGKATGAALATTKKHSKDSDLKLYGACFCPFSQRVWIALEAKGLPYQYCETDPFRRPAPTQLLEANPRGLVPAIRQGDWACAESEVILEYLEDMDDNVPLFPSDPRLKANCRLWIDHINTNIVPAFYTVLQAQDIASQAESTDRLQSHLASLALAADEHGPFFLGATLSIVDIHFAPFALRLHRILRPLRGWAEPFRGDSRLQRWLGALEGDVHVRATTSADELYVETAEVLMRRR